MFGPGAEAVMRVDAAERGVGRALDERRVPRRGLGRHPGAFRPERRPRTAAPNLRFRHEGLTPKLECFADCKSGWDHFIPSLAAYVETGRDNPNQSEADLARREARARQRESANAG